MSTKTLVTILIILVVIVGGLLIYRMMQSESTESTPSTNTPSEEPSQPQDNQTSENDELYADIPQEERQAVRDWIEENDLNRYGDSQDTMYTGGTPLFDEEKGERTSLYDYLLENHPDKPWLSQDEEKNTDRTDTSEERIPFSRVQNWKRYETPEYSIEYPVDSDIIEAQVEEQKRSAVEVQFTTKDGFALEVVTNEKGATVSNCVEKPRFDRFVCYNDQNQYQDIYQRMSDSMRENRIY